MNTQTLLQKAQALPQKDTLESQFPAIDALRAKGYTWREIAAFLSDNGVPADHSKVFRIWTKLSGRFEVPEATQYVEALTRLDTDGRLSAGDRAMLLAHYQSHNRSITYGELARVLAATRGEDVEKASFQIANSAYGALGRRLGEALGMTFARAEERDSDFFSSAIGVGRAEQKSGERFELVMHHELSKALRALGWAKD